MPKRLETPLWERHFPTYKLGGNEIGLAEYQAAVARAQSDEQALSVTNGLLVAAVAPLIPTSASFIHAWIQQGDISDKAINLAILVIVVLVITMIAASYICQLRRSQVFSARKVIVLRRMMGQDYGPTTLVLPNWRLEGADNPFALRMFSGWSVRTAYPFYALAIIGCIPICYAIYVFSANYHIFEPIFPAWNPRLSRLIISLAAGVLFSIIILTYIRRELLDHGETIFLRFTLFLSRLFFMNLNRNIQTTMYQARLSRIEVHRLQIPLDQLKIFAICREDRRYFSHIGIDIFAMGRAAIERMRGNRAGGGTTITQQVARTLFIPEMSKTIRRKLFEVPLAIWLNGITSKNELLEIYLSSVRYDHGVLGIAAARRHFFGPRTKLLGKDRSFILIERIANISSDFRSDSIAKMLKKFLDLKLIDDDDASNILQLYDRLITSGKLKQGKGHTPSETAAALGLRFQSKQFSMKDK